MNLGRRRFRLALTAIVIGVALPIIPCPRSGWLTACGGKSWCREDYRQWMNAARNPRAAPQESAAVQQWAETHQCDYCGNTDWTSAVRWRWVHLRGQLQNFP